jgi:hypothetical protein
MAASEIFGFVLMVAGAYALICWFAFTLRNLSDALDYSSDDIANRDSMTTPWGEVVRLPNDFRGVKARAEMAGRGSGACEREPSVIKQSHNQVPDIARPESPL